MTGAVLPKDCNIVIMKEEISKLNNDNIIINSKNVKIYQNIRFAGEDIKPNKVLIKKFHIAKVNNSKDVEVWGSGKSMRETLKLIGLQVKSCGFLGIGPVCRIIICPTFSIRIIMKH